MVSVPTAAVGAVGTPVSDGEANGALSSNAEWTPPDVTIFVDDAVGVVSTDVFPVPPCATGNVPNTPGAFAAVLMADGRDSLFQAAHVISLSPRELAQLKCPPMVELLKRQLKKSKKWIKMMSFMKLCLRKLHF